MLRARIKKILPDPARIKSLAVVRALGIRSNPSLWLINRHAISRAVAIGIFCAYLPMPLEMLPAAALAVVCRANLPLAIALVWISNPLTWLILYTPPYLLGAALLDTPAAALSLDTMVHGFAALWLGCLIFGVVGSGVGYFLVRGIWWAVVMKVRGRWG